MSEYFYLEAWWQVRGIALDQAKIQMPVQDLFNDLVRIENSDMESHLRITGTKTRYNRREQIDPCRRVSGKLDFPSLDIT